jgi:sulfate-transporting ATPase
VTFYQFTLLGLTTGGAYALISLGVVTVYRGTRIVNFAQGALGMTGTYLFWTLFHDHGLPLGLALAIALALGGAMGLVFYLLVARHLSDAPATTKTLVTLGLFLATQTLVIIAWGTQPILVTPFLVSGGVTVFGAQLQWIAVLLVSIAIGLTIALTIAFRWTRFGRVTTALADSPVGAQAIGYSPLPWGAVTWIGGGMIAVLAEVLLAPVTGLSPSALGVLVVPALGAALVAGFSRFWVALVVSLVAGIGQSLATGYDVSPGLSAAMPALLAIGALIVSGRVLPGRGSTEAVRLFRVGTGRIRPMRVGVGVGLVVLAVLLSSNSWADTLSTSAIFSLVGLSVVVSAGFAGQVSLATMSLAGVGAISAGWFGYWGAPLWVTVLAPIVVTVVIGLILGLPAVRVRGVGLTIGTLALAALIQAWVFASGPILHQPAGLRIKHVTLFGLAVDPGAHPHRFAVVTWVLLILGAIAVANLRRSRAGRRLLAVRSNERAAAAAGISVVSAKAWAFALSAALTGLAGALLAVQIGTVGGAVGGFGNGFSYYDSLTIAGIAVLCGAGYVMGGVVTGLIVAGGVFERVLNLGPTGNNYLALIFGLNLIVVLVREPDGLAGQAARIKQQVVDFVQARRGVASPESTTVVDSGRPDPAAVAALIAPVPLPASGPATALDVRHLTVHYGGITAVDDVSLSLRAGTVLGVLGPNGAGKSSLVDAITGFVPARGGQVALLGHDITRLRPHRRAAHGLVRTFQDHLLFEELTVRENLLAAAERKDTIGYLSGLVRPGDGRSAETVAAAAALCGLTPYLDEPVESLSLGWHARVALARAFAARPRVLCLDEPAAGLSAGARREIAAVVRRAAHELNIAVLLVEHNIDVILDACDEIVVLDHGREIAHGEPEAVLALPSVRQAYLGDVIDRDDTPSVIDSIVGVPA